MKSLKQEMQFSVTKSVLINGEYFKYKGQVHSPTMAQKHDPFTLIFTFLPAFVLLGFLTALLYRVDKRILIPLLHH